MSFCCETDDLMMMFSYSVSVSLDAFPCFINTTGKIFACFGTIDKPFWIAMYCSYIHAFKKYHLRI